MSWLILGALKINDKKATNSIMFPRIHFSIDSPSTYRALLRNFIDCKEIIRGDKNSWRDSFSVLNNKKHVCVRTRFNNGYLVRTTKGRPQFYVIREGCSQRPVFPP